MNYFVYQKAWKYICHIQLIVTAKKPPAKFQHKNVNEFFIFFFLFYRIRFKMLLRVVLMISLLLTLGSLLVSGFVIYQRPVMYQYRYTVPFGMGGVSPGVGGPILYYTNGDIDWNT